MSIVTVALADIAVADRLRVVDEDWAQAIAASIEAHGLMEPLVVRPAKGGKPAPFLLVAGAHRHRALQILGIETAEAKVVEMSPAEARLAEIDENLMRREVDALDRAIFLAERKRVYEELHPETRVGENQHTRVRHDGEPIAARFTDEVCEKIGLSERTVQRAVELIGHLAPAAVALLRGTPLASNGAQLAALSRWTPEEQEALAELLADGRAANVAQARRVHAGRPDPAPEAPVDLQTRKLLSAWNAAGTTARKRFLDDIGADLRPKPRRDA